jgi:hypothetical protein
MVTAYQCFGSLDSPFRYDSGKFGGSGGLNVAIFRKIYTSCELSVALVVLQDSVSF